MIEAWFYYDQLVLWALKIDIASKLDHIQLQDTTRNKTKHFLN